MSRKAAFFKVEGSLVRTQGLPPAAYFILNQREMKSRVTRLGGLIAAAGMSLASPLGEAQTATRLAWSSLRGMSEDRLHILAEELFDRQLLKSLRAPGVELVEGAKRDGYMIVLVTELLDLSVKPLAKRLGADHLIANRMEIQAHKATGRLLDPIVAQLSGQWAQAFAKEHDVDLSASLAYGSSGGDALLMSAVGKPCAIHPDWRLRKIAKDHGWPIVEAVG